MLSTPYVNNPKREPAGTGAKAAVKARRQVRKEKGLGRLTTRISLAGFSACRRSGAVEVVYRSTTAPLHPHTPYKGGGGAVALRHCDTLRRSTLRGGAL